MITSNFNVRHYREEMEAEIAEGKFLEYAEVHGNFYGTSSDSVQTVSRGRGVVENEHPTEIEFPAPPPRVCKSIHPEGKIRHAPILVERLFSMTLLRGGKIPLLDIDVQAGGVLRTHTRPDCISSSSNARLYPI